LNRPSLAGFDSTPDNSAHAFKVDQLTPSADDRAMLFSRFAYDERGEGVFRFSHQR
jgi:hypothetical protein